MTDLDPTGTQPISDQVNEPTVNTLFEPTVDAAPAMPVQSSESTPRQRPLRWPIAIGLVALVVAVSAVVGILVTGKAPHAKVLGYVPDGTIVYGEARLDLPGDQRSALASFLSRFPGFADQAAVETKLNEVMDRIVGGVTNGDQAYTKDIQPWFDGELAFAVGPLPDPATVSRGGSSTTGRARFLVLVSIKDEAKATTWFKSVATSSGVTLSDEAYDGVNLTILAGEGAMQGAYAVLDGKVAVVGDVDSVKAAADTQGKGPFAGQASPRAALDGTDSGHVGFLYVDTAALLDWASRLSQAGGSSVAPGLDFSTSTLRGLIPAWEGLALRIEGDAVVLEAAVDRPAGNIGPTDNRASIVANHVPASALVVGVGHDVGAMLIDMLNLYRSEPSMKSLADGIDQVAGVLGGVDGAVAWIGDAGYVVNEAEGGIEGGVVIVPTDRAAADRTITSLRTLLSLGAAQAGLSITDEAYAGATITTIDLGDIAALAGQAGVPADPSGTGLTLPTGHVQLAYAVTDQVVVIGSGAAFVKHVLDTTAAASIASADRYKALLGRIGSGTGSVYVDITGIRGLIESAMAGADPAAVAQYEQEVKPFLAPFDALIESSSVKDNVANGKFIVTVK